MRSALGAAFTAALAVASVAPAQARPAMSPLLAVPSGRVAALAHPAIYARTTRDLGRTNDNRVLHLTIGMKAHNRALLNTILARQKTPGDSLFGRFLTPSESAALFSPKGVDVAIVGKYLVTHGFKNVHVTPDNLLVTADVTSAIASRAFNTEIHDLAFAGRRIYANVRPAMMPAEFAGKINGIEGLNSVPMIPDLRKTALTPAQLDLAKRRMAAHKARLAHLGSPLNADPVPTAAPCSGTAVGPTCLLSEFDAADFRTAYDVPSPKPGKALTQYGGHKTVEAIFTEGDMTGVLSDLRLAEAANGLPQANVTVVNVGIASPDASGADEWDLDTQSSTGMAYQVKGVILYVATSLTDADTSVAFDRFKTDDIAKGGSASFGSCEVFPATDGSLTTDDEIFAEAAVQGQTVFSSAGDNGYGCAAVAATGVPGTGPPVPNYPATSDYVISVGGTTLFHKAADGTYDGEAMWIGTGGGQDVEEVGPFWQNGIVLPGSAEGKENPDIAMDADNQLSPAIVYVNGAAEGVGGTSLASPLALGVWDWIESQNKNAIGFAAPLFYQEYATATGCNQAPVSVAGEANSPVNPPCNKPTPTLSTGQTTATTNYAGFHDEILGNNGTPALPGFDFGTGLGSLDVSLQLQYLPKTYATSYGPTQTVP